MHRKKRDQRGTVMTLNALAFHTRDGSGSTVVQIKDRLIAIGSYGSC